MGAATLMIEWDVSEGWMIGWPFPRAGTDGRQAGAH